MEILVSIFGRELARYAARRAVRLVRRNMGWLALIALVVVGWYVLSSSGAHVQWSTYRPSLPQLWGMR